MSSGQPVFDVLVFLRSAGAGKTILPFKKGETIFSQGDSCNAVFYIQSGHCKLTIVSETGKEATIALLNPGDFAGEECVSTTQPCHSAKASALTNCLVSRIDNKEMLRIMRDQPELSGFFVAYILSRANRIQADLVDQLFNSTEKRLARILLHLAHFGQADTQQTLIPKISQETLAGMVGCTRSRVNFFLNRFRRLGFIAYGDQIQVNKTLLQVIARD